MLTIDNVIYYAKCETMKSLKHVGKIPNIDASRRKRILKHGTKPCIYCVLQLIKSNIVSWSSINNSNTGIY